MSTPKATRPIPNDVSTWPEEMQYLHRERAAIKEFDGNTPRLRAEREALREVWDASEFGEGEK